MTNIELANDLQVHRSRTKDQTDVLGLSDMRRRLYTYAGKEVDVNSPRICPTCIHGTRQRTTFPSRHFSPISNVRSVLIGTSEWIGLFVRLECISPCYVPSTSRMVERIRSPLPCKQQNENELGISGNPIDRL